jgi:hypothetical protein
MRIIKWAAIIIGLTALIPNQTKAVVFCLFMAIVVGISFLTLGVIVAIMRVKDRIVGDRFTGNSRDHRN